MKRLIFLFLLAAGFSAGAQFDLKQVVPIKSEWKFSVAMPVNHDVEVVAIMSSADSEIVSMTSISDYKTFAPSRNYVALSEPDYSYPINSGIGWCSSITYLDNSNYNLNLSDVANLYIDPVQRE